MAGKSTLIAFDADDTLWHNERFFHLTQQHFAALLADYTAPNHLSERLLAAEHRNLGRYGFGVKGFTLSMIETALEVTDDKVPGHVIRELVEAGREMLAHPVELLPHVRMVIKTLAPDHHISLITKGDLLDQERKLAASGLGDFFDSVEIVSHKTPEIYAKAFARHATSPENACMVGNSMRSDVLPAIKAGGWGIFVPHDLSWHLEHAEPPTDKAQFREIPDLSALPAMIESLF